MISTRNTSIFTTADKILFLLTLSFIIFSYFYFWQSTPASYVLIKSPEKNISFIDLNQPQIHQIQGLLGISTLQVKNKQIRFTASPCKNKICIQSGWHQHNGSVAACLPNRIIVQLTSRDAKKEFDAIIF